MSFIRRIISRYSTEYAFISDFISSLTEADNRISCLTADLESQFENSSARPCFEISIAVICTLRFERISQLEYTDYCYSVTDWNGIVTGMLYFANNPIAASQQMKRSYKYAVQANDSVINLSLYSFLNEMYSPEISCTVIADGNNTCYGIAEDKTSAIGEDLINAENAVFVKQDRLSYIFSEESASSAELIRNKVFCDGTSGVRAFATEGLYDITTVTPDTVITVSSRNYYALDGHTIMEV